MASVASISGVPASGDGALPLPVELHDDWRHPLCEAGIDSPGSTSLKWGADGELAAQDLHQVLARLLACDQEAMRMIAPEDCSP